MEKLTLIEPHVHFDDAQFSSGMRPGADDEQDREATGSESGGGLRRVVGLLALGVLVSVAVALAARRLFGADGDGGVDVDVESGPDPGAGTGGPDSEAFVE